MRGYISMSTKEVDRITILENVLHKRIKQKHAAKQLGISTRQVIRMMKRYRREGAKGLIHKNRGRASNRALGTKESAMITDLIAKYYHDFGPTFASEKLAEHHRVFRSHETVRQLMIASDIWKPKRRKTVALHPYRPRRACIGELAQLDGSPHHWFEDRSDPCTLIAFIDDATSRIMDGMFVDFEGTFTFFEALKHYLLLHGKPLSLYVDKHSTFKINRQATIEEDLRDTQVQTQFARAMEELRIELIFAHSPQAKGRVERLFETLQDRLVKEMRLAGISNQQTGTKYFRRVYIPKHNTKFAVAPKDKANMHRVLLQADDLTRIFTVQSKRKVDKNLIVQYKNTKHQLTPQNGYRLTLRNSAITVEEEREGNLTFRYKDKAIPYEIAQSQIHRRKPIQIAETKTFKERRVYIPSANHPWRRDFITA